MQHELSPGYTFERNNGSVGRSDNLEILDRWYAELFQTCFDVSLYMKLLVLREIFRDELKSV